MTQLATYDGFVKRAADGYIWRQPIANEVVATTAIPVGVANGLQRIGYTKALPSLPAGVSAYIVTDFGLARSTTTRWMFAKLIDMGSINLNTGTFTDGVAYPTVTELGVSRVTYGAVICQVTTAVSGASGTITMTYTNQDGTGSRSITPNINAAAFAVDSASLVLAGAAPALGLQGTDYGVRDITAVTRSNAATTGVLQFYGIVPLYISSSINVGYIDSTNLLIQSFCPVRLGAGDVLAAFALLNTTAHYSWGDVVVLGDT